MTLAQTREIAYEYSFHENRKILNSVNSPVSMRNEMTDERTKERISP